MKPTRACMIHGAIGALVTPVAMVILALSRSLFPHDSLMHRALSLAFTVILTPATWSIEKVLAACGVHGDGGMAYLVPIFGALLVYSALLGFVGGGAVGKLWNIRNR